MFTDYQYEALGVPRNTTLAVNHDPKFYDMGVCGPFRDDIKDQTQYCGMFLTPTLRNSATRQVFFHNGVYHSLDDVMAFYNDRNTAPEKFYPKGADGKVNKYDDLPAQVPREHRRGRRAVRPQVRRQARDDGSGDEGHHRVPAYPDRRLSQGQLTWSISFWRA